MLARTIFQNRRSRRRGVVTLAPVLAAVTLLLPACGSGSGGGDSGTEPPPAESDPLRELAGARGILIGSAADRGFTLSGTAGEEFRQVLAREFNALTPENDMKHAGIHPAEDDYAFDGADALVDFAEANGMEVRGHTLVWHRQLASWLTDGTWTPTEAEALMRDHIAAVAGHYRGRLTAWDVVNEAVGDDGSLRPGFWADHIGPEYIEIAFHEARQADPDAALFYNDYGILWLNAKSDAVYAMLADLVDRGVPVDGIGFQGHIVVGGAPSRTDLAANFQRFADLGLKIHVTELDVRIQMPASTAELHQQAQDYALVVNVCLEEPACEAIVTWGFTDADSWIPDAFPGYGAATLLDANYQPKPAYHAVSEALSGS
jgi:endo-1,4-beta-xylanase